MKHAGGCLCGAVRFEAEGSPRSVFHCHCASCRRQLAAPVASFAVYETSADRFRWSKAAPATHASSPGVTRSFCPTCGTPLSYQAEKYPGEIHLHVGAFDHPENFVPTAHYHSAEKIAWFDTADRLPRHPHGSATDGTQEESWGADEA